LVFRRQRATLHSRPCPSLISSTDSRAFSAAGYIPLKNVIGRVGMIFFSLDAGDNGATPAIRYERIGTAVRC
jgi:signal peptidase I